MDEVSPDYEIAVEPSGQISAISVESGKLKLHDPAYLCDTGMEPGIYAVTQIKGLEE